MKVAEPPFLTNAPASAAAPCEARLSLGFTDDGGVTRLTDRRHFGPLRVQKALYPEHPSVCHAVIIHPPGGVVGGDRLQIDADVGAGAAALLTTPGAAKWYKANGRVSSQHVHLTVGAGGAIEWLPQETIFFNHADVALHQRVDLAAGARYIGGDILCFGRTASGERFDSGRVAQHASIRLDGRLLWWEQGAIDAVGGSGGDSMQGALALGGHTVCATLLAVGTLPPAFIAGLRGVALAAAAPDIGPDGKTAQTGVSQLKSLVVARYLGHSSAAARAWMSACWRHIRPELLGREAVTPRIWHT
ncbi:MAG: ureD [Herbaspirillum sp.]|jgi:urease accessory protein|nr:ureD [Herbaspirillum sp.]